MKYEFKAVAWIAKTIFKLYLKKKKREAEKLAKLYNRQYHVIKVDNGQLKCVNSDFVKLYNKFYKRKMTTIELRNKAVYSTKIN